jgi:hypothetical protein
MSPTLILCLVVLLGIGIGTNNLIYTFAEVRDFDNIATTDNILVKNGRISSIILGVTPQSGTFDINTVPKFLLSGDWNMTVKKEENSANFMANFTTVSILGTNLHNHKFINFKTANDISSNNSHSGNNNLKLFGTMDISTNDLIKWKNVKTNISTYNDNTIVIDFDDKATDNHFIGQPVYGTVERITS